MYDFTLTSTDGKELNLYTLLEEKKVVILNFWYTTCSACYYEFPYMVEAYESTYVDEYGNTKNYKDDVAIIAINPTIAGGGDTLEEIISFKNQMGLTFDVALDLDGDEQNLTFDPLLTTQFAVNAYPTTFVIDSFGLIAEIGVGAVTATDKWTQTFDKYLGEDYYPKYTGQMTDEELMVKPDITQEDSSVLEDAINGTNYDGSKFDGTFIWPLDYSPRRVTSGMKIRWGRWHKGIDIGTNAEDGKRVVAAASGTVIYSAYQYGTSSSPGYGNYLIIYHGNGFATLYAHMQSKAVGSGTYVSQGQTIGYSGSTGGVAPHLHFEIRKASSVGNFFGVNNWLDPLDYLPGGYTRVD